jgi:hypothetical protein
LRLPLQHSSIFQRQLLIPSGPAASPAGARARS